MFIKKLIIKNFRCFDNEGISINLNKGLTAFIGANGSGKTTILEALDLLLGQEYLPNKIDERDFNCMANNIKDSILIEVETEKPFFITLDLVSIQNFVVNKNVRIPCTGMRLSIKRREIGEKVLDDPFRIEKTVAPLTGEVDDSVYSGIKTGYKTKSIVKESTGYLVTYLLKNGETRNAKVLNHQLVYNPNKLSGCPKSYYLTTDRDKEVRGSYSLIGKILTDLHWKYKKTKIESDSNEFEEQYRVLSSSLRIAVDEKEKLIRFINEQVAKISSQDKNFQIDFLNIEQPYKTAFLSKEEQNKILLPDDLGSGFNILTAYSLFSYVARLEKIPIVLLIDEPELHLHSDWQVKMYNLFSNDESIQIVYSTQSENFISLKNWRQIRSIHSSKVFPSENLSEVSVESTDGETATIEQYLDDYARRNLHISTILRENLELFFSQKCILVEGPGEKYALPKLLALKGCKLEDFSVSIIPTWGKTKIKIYQIVCKAFGIDFFTVFDTDKKNSDEPDNENLAIEKNSNEGKLFKFSTSFEKLLGISDSDKFQSLIGLIDKLENLKTLNTEINKAIDTLNNYLEN